MDIIPIPGFSEPVSSISHLAAAIFFGLSNALCLRRSSGNKLRVIALTVNFICVVYLFSMSGVYHLLDPQGVSREVFQRLDHSAIWSMIAGTFTPIHLILFRGFWRWGVLGIVWITAITGLVLKTIYFHEVPEALSLSLYLGLGWFGVLSAWRFHKLYNDAALRYLVYGGIAYSMGGLLEFLRWPVLWQGVIGPHELFHAFVVLGAYFHWRFILTICRFAPYDKLTFSAEALPEGQFMVRAVDENIEFHANSLHQIKPNIVRHLDQNFVSHAQPKIIRLRYIYNEWHDLELPQEKVQEAK